MSDDIEPRIVSNMRVVLDEMVGQNADIGWQMSLRELLSVIEHPLTKRMPSRDALKARITADPDLENDVVFASPNQRTDGLMSRSFYDRTSYDPLPAFLDTRESQLEYAMEIQHGWIKHWMDDVKAGIKPTETSLSAALANVERALSIPKERKVARLAIQSKSSNAQEL